VICHENASFCSRAEQFAHPVPPKRSKSILRGGPARELNPAVQLRDEPRTLRFLAVKFGVQLISGMNQPRTRFDADGSRLIESFKDRDDPLFECRNLEPGLLSSEMFADGG
jgi:hypothetical protein